MVEKLIEKLVDRAPLAIVMIGVVVFVIGAAGGLPLGSPPLQITDPVWRIALGTMGAILVIAGVLLTFRETAPEATAQEKGAPPKPSGRGARSPLQGAPEVFPLSDPRLRNLVPPLSQRFRMVQLPPVQPPTVYGTPYAPVGLLMIDEIPFFLEPFFDPGGRLLGHRTITVQPGEHNAERIVVIPANIRSVAQLHCLLAAEHGWTERDGVQFVDKRIGYIELVFVDQSVQRVDLVLGRDIREWAFGNSPELVRDINQITTKPAWISHDTHYLIDVLSIPVRHKQPDLTSIRIIAKFQDDPGTSILLPAILISAITCSLAS